MKELFEAPEEMQRLLAVLAENRRRLEADMNTGLAHKGGPNKDHISAARELASAMANLGKEMRQWAGFQRTSMDKMSPAAKTRVIVQFIQDELPLGPRRDLYTILAGLESKRADGVGLAVADKFGSTPDRVDSDE